MRNYKKAMLVCIACLCSFCAISQITTEHVADTTKKSRGIIDTLTYETQAGLPIAASKIYFSDQKFTFSGFGETGYINYLGPKDRTSGDIELYMTNLYRFVSYLAYKPVPWLVLYGEIFGEVFMDKNLETDYEFFVEVFADFLIHENFNVRVGTHQVQIGYVNNNDEPIQYFSVNRPEVERIIIPSQWIDLGIMTYGKITNDLSYTFSVYQGLDARGYNGGTWIRRGRNDEFRGVFNSVVLNSQLEYNGIKNTTLNVAGLWTQAGSNEVVNLGGIDTKVKANTYLLSSFVRNTYKNWSFMALGSVGSMSDTDLIFELTRPVSSGDADPDIGQVLGSTVHGYYLEVGYDILPLFRDKKKASQRKNVLINSKEMKLPLFARFEQLNTHSRIDDSLRDIPRFQSNLSALTVGLNFNPKRSIVLKANYQFRWNKQPLPSGLFEGDRFELGMGFIF